MYVNDILGPFDLLQKIAPAPITVVTIPFSRVDGAQVALVVEDNINVVAVNLNEIFFAEIEIVGFIRGVGDVLRRVMMRGATGPVVHSFAREQAFENIEIRARNMTGGRVPPSDDPYLATTSQSNIDPRTGGLQTTISNAFFARLTVTIQPRRNKETRPNG